jgi:hypothetical protein
VIDGQIVLTRDRSSGHVHKRVRLGSGLATLEGDNLDESGLYDVLATLADVDPADLCRHCFAQSKRERALMDTASMGTD